MRGTYTDIAMECYIPSNHQQRRFPSISLPLLLFASALSKHSSRCYGIYPPVWVHICWFSTSDHCLPHGKSADLYIDPLSLHSRQKELQCKCHHQHREIFQIPSPNILPAIPASTANHWSSNPAALMRTCLHKEIRHRAVSILLEKQSACITLLVLMCSVILSQPSAPKSHLCSEVHVIYCLCDVWIQWITVVSKQMFSKHNKKIVLRNMGINEDGQRRFIIKIDFILILERDHHSPWTLWQRNQSNVRSLQKWLSSWCLLYWPLPPYALWSTIFKQGCVNWSSKWIVQWCNLDGETAEKIRGWGIFGLSDSSLLHNLRHSAFQEAE